MNLADEIKSRVSMRQAAIQYGFQPNRGGFIRCPFHDEKTPSMKVYEGDRGFSCYGCGQYGSVIDFVEQLYNINFQQAVARINSDFNLNLPVGKRLTFREQRAAAQQERRLRERRQAEMEFAEAADNAYYDALSDWLRLEQNFARYQPKSPDDELHPQFTDALTNLVFARERLEITNTKRLQHERNCHCYTGLDDSRLSNADSVRVAIQV